MLCQGPLLPTPHPAGARLAPPGSRAGRPTSQLLKAQGCAHSHGLFKGSVLMLLSGCLQLDHASGGSSRLQGLGWWRSGSGQGCPWTLRNVLWEVRKTLTMQRLLQVCGWGSQDCRHCRVAPVAAPPTCPPSLSPPCVAPAHSCHQNPSLSPPHCGANEFSREAPRAQHVASSTPGPRPWACL